MPNDEKKSVPPSPSRFPSRKRRRSFAPPKGITPTAKEAAAPQSPKEQAPEAARPNGAPTGENNQPNRPLPKKNKKPFHKNRPRKNREQRNPAEQTALREKTAPLTQSVEEAAAEKAVEIESLCQGACGVCEGCAQEQKPQEDGPKVTVVGVRFKESGKIYYFDPRDLSPQKGQSVIVETSRGVECGTVAVANRQIRQASLTSPLKKVVRIANEQDLKKVSQLREQEAHAKEVWEKKLQDHKLDMALVDVEFTFDSQKLIFYFTAEGRVDFRDFVKDLATVFKTRIELRQIGVRDEAKQIGGLGVCGRPFCCKTFLDDFQQVSIKMAKEQNLSLNSVKISGTCGRLMCCLRYENEVYEQESKKTPRADTLVMTPDGRGVVTENNVLKGTCKVRLDQKPDLAPTEYHRDQLQVLGKVSRRSRGKSEEASAEEEKNN